MRNSRLSLLRFFATAVATGLPGGALFAVAIRLLLGASFGLCALVGLLVLGVLFDEELAVQSVAFFRAAAVATGLPGGALFAVGLLGASFGLRALVGRLVLGVLFDEELAVQSVAFFRAAA